MATVRKFDETMIESCLRTVDLKYLKDSDGDYVVQFGYDDDTKCELSLFLIRSGEKKEVFQILVASDAEIPASELGAALFFCNSWNKDKRWPKTYVNFKEGESHGRIFCEEQIDLEKGVHQELLDDFAITCFSAANAFWKQVGEEKPFSFRR